MCQRDSPPYQLFAAVPQLQDIGYYEAGARSSDDGENMIGFLACMLTFGLLVHVAPLADAPAWQDIRRDVAPRSTPGGDFLSSAVPERSLAVTSFSGLPDSIDLGVVALGYCKDTVITVPLAPGTRAPVFPKLALFASSFHVAPDSVIPVADSITFTITFCPQNEGQSSDSLLLVVDGSMRPATVLLFGRGVRTVLPFGGDTLVDMGRVPQNDPRDTVTAIARGTSLGMFEIYSVDFIGAAGPFSVMAPAGLIRLGPGNDADSIRLRVLGSAPGPHDAYLQIRTNVGVRTIRVHAVVDSASGSGSDTLVTAEPSRIDFGGVPIGYCVTRTLVIRNRGTDPVSVRQMLVQSGAAFSIDPASDTDKVVGAGDSVTISIRYCPDSARTDLATSRIRPGDRGLISVIMQGYGFKGLWEGVPEVIDFGAVPIDSLCVDTTLSYLNVVPIDLATVELAGAKDAFEILSPVTGQQLRAGDSLKIRIRFCPTDTGTVNDELVAIDGGRRTQVLGITLVGTGTLTGEGGGREGVRIWLDTTTARVGQTARLTMRSNHSFTAGEGIRFASATFVINPHALVPGRATPIGIATGAGMLRLIAIDDSTYRVEPPVGSVLLQGPDLLALEFTGLSTGQYENVVGFREVSLTGAPGAVISANGLVKLLGCDIERTGAFTRRVAIRAIRTDAASSVVAVTYDAPEGSAPTLGLINVAGERVMTRALPYGTGGEQSVSVALEGAPPGFYILELRVEDDLSTARIMVPR